MLKAAKGYEKQLNDKLCDRAMDSDMKYYHGGFAELSIGIDDSFWNKVQMVSIDSKDNVLGYFKASYARPENFINGISCLSFEGPNMTFAKDLINFLRYLINELEVPKIKWNVTIGNPVEKHYDRICKKVGGRVIGTDRFDVLIGNKYHDNKSYEWINDYYECMYCGHREKIEQEVICWKCGKGEMIYYNPFRR